MSKTIAIITFKDKPGRRFKVEKGHKELCMNKKEKMCSFFNTPCDRVLLDICSQKKACYVFYEIK